MKPGSVEWKLWVVRCRRALKDFYKSRGIDYKRDIQTAVHMGTLMRAWDFLDMRGLILPGMLRTEFIDAAKFEAMKERLLRRR